MRLIDADALIGKLHNYRFYDGDDRTIVYAVIENQPTIEPQKWIPLTEMVPDEETDVLVCSDTGNIRIAKGYWATDINDTWVWPTLTKQEFGWAIAWMPLPPAYNGEEE